MAGLEGLLAGRTLAGRYRIEEVIGRGGFAAVYRATDERLGRTVAVKVIILSAADAQSREEIRQRFGREARSAASLHHPNVVTIFDFGTDPELGLDFLVMELLAGEDLAAHLSGAGPLPLDVALRVFRDAARGVDAGHRMGLVHRDIKPGNLFLARGDRPGRWRVCVLDFGIARFTGGDATPLTRAGGGFFSPAYASPEQLRGQRRLTPASDVFSLGVIGYELLGGERPFPGDRLGGDDPPVVPLRERNPAVPPAVADAIHRALSPVAEDRFADAGALVEVLSAPDAAPVIVAPALAADAPEPEAVKRVEAAAEPESIQPVPEMAAPQPEPVSEPVPVPAAPAEPPVVVEPPVVTPPPVVAEPGIPRHAEAAPEPRVTPAPVVASPPPPRSGAPAAQRKAGPRVPALTLVLLLGLATVLAGWWALGRDGEPVRTADRGSDRPGESEARREGTTGEGTQGDAEPGTAPTGTTPAAPRSAPAGTGAGASESAETGGPITTVPPTTGSSSATGAPRAAGAAQTSEVSAVSTTPRPLPAPVATAPRTPAPPRTAEPAPAAPAPRTPPRPAPRVASAARPPAAAGSAMALNREGEAFFARGNFSAAVERFRQAVRAAPGNAYYHNNLGWALFQAGDLDGAGRELDEAVRLDPRRDIAYANIGEVRWARGDREGAIAAYRRFLELNTNPRRERIATEKLRRMGAVP